MALASSFTSLHETPHRPDPASAERHASRLSRECWVPDGAESRRRSRAPLAVGGGHERNRPPGAAGVREPLTTTMATDWKPICRIEDIPVLGARRIQRQTGTEVAVFRAADDHVFALLDRCPHKGGPLSQGIVFGHSVACPLHNWTIGLDDGCARAPDVGCAVTFSVMCEGGMVHLDAVELATRGLEGHFDTAQPGAPGDESAASSMAAQAED